MSVGFFVLLILLRLDAEHFGAAEYDEVARDGHFPSLRRLRSTLLIGHDPTPATVIQALGYVLATRVAAPGRDRYMLVLVLILGLGSGWVTMQTGGLGAAFIGHAITRVAVFLATGHAG